MIIIGVMGKKRSGKDTVANYFVRYHNCMRYAFADPMKEMVKKAFLWDEEWVNGKYKETIDIRWGISPRQALQHIGTEWAQLGLCKAYEEFEKITGRNLWVKNFIYSFLHHKKPPTVISDVRFPHEIEAIKNSPDLAGVKKIFIKIERPEIEKIKDDHESEKYIDVLTFDYKIINDGTIEELENKAGDVLTQEVVKGMSKELLETMFK